MRIACKDLLGTQNFKNLCKIDKNVTNFIRTIISCSIEPTDTNYINNFTNYNNISNINSIYKTYVLTVTGTSFLYNQIRCIMSALFRIGKKLENQKYIYELLNTKNSIQRKYQIADPLPLIFWDCTFDSSWNINWLSSINNTVSILKKNLNIVRTLYIQQIINANFLNTIFDNFYKLLYIHKERYLKLLNTTTNNNNTNNDNTIISTCIGIQDTYPEIIDTINIPPIEPYYLYKIIIKLSILGFQLQPNKTKYPY